MRNLERREDPSRKIVTDLWFIAELRTLSLIREALQTENLTLPAKIKD